MTSEPAPLSTQSDSAVQSATVQPRYRRVTRRNQASRHQRSAVSAVGARVAHYGLTKVLQRAVDDNGTPHPLVNTAMLKGMAAQRPGVMSHLRRMRKKYPDHAPAELADLLTKQYVKAAAGSGAALGSVAVAPSVDTLASLGISTAGTATFLELTALYVQAIAELHGVRTHDDDRGQSLVLAVLLGEDGRRLLREVTGQSQQNAAVSSTVWLFTHSDNATVLTQRLLEKANGHLMRRTAGRAAARHSAHLLGRALPYGIGAVVGGIGNRSMATSVVASAQRLFGPLDSQLPPEIVNPDQLITADQDDSSGQ